MKSALNKKWFLLSEESKFSPDFRWVPDRETRVLEDSNGLQWQISGVSHGEQYSWTYSVQKEGVMMQVFNCIGIDMIITHHLSDTVDIGTYYKDGALVGGFYYEIKRDAQDGKEYLHVIDTGVHRSGKPLYKVMKYTSAKL
jgi:hypothetical protein